MFRYKTILVAGTDAIETVSSLLVGTEQIKKRVHGIFVSEVTAALQYDARVRLYLETDQVCDFPIVHLLNGAAVGLNPAPPYIPIGVDLEPGQELKAGHLSGATASDLRITVQYEHVT